MPVAFSTMVYASYGVGVLLGGPLFDGIGSKRLGTRWALLSSILTGLLAVGIVLTTQSIWPVVLSGALLGAAQMGAVSLTAHFTLDLVGPSRHTQWWGRMVTGFNIGLALGSVAMGAMIHIKWGFLAGFWMGGGCFVLSALLTLFIKSSQLETPLIEASS